MITPPTDDIRELAGHALIGCTDRNAVLLGDAFQRVIAWLNAMPQPDWSQAPDWAQWWAVDSCGHPFWFENKPYFRRQEPSCVWHNQKGKEQRLSWLDLPVGIDWRCTLRERPQP